MAISPRLLQLSSRLVGLGTLSAFTLGAGLLRELVLAAEFGLSAALDVYVILVTLYAFFGIQFGHVLEQILVAKLAGETDPDIVNASQSSVLIVVAAFNALFICLVWLGDSARWIAAAFPEFTPAQAEIGSHLLLLMLIAASLMNCSGVIRGALHINGTFWPGFASGGLVAATVAATVISVGTKMGVIAIGIGMLVGAAAVLMLHIFVLKQNKLPLTPTFRPLLVAAILWPTLPYMTANEVVYQAAELLQRVYATSLGTGTASALYYAFAVVQAFSALLFAPLTKILFPRITRLMSTQVPQAGRLLLRAAGALLAMSAVATTALLYVGEELVNILFVRGNFGVEDAKLTASLVGVLAFLLPFMSVNRLIRYGLYASKEFAQPIILNIARLVTFAGLAAVLMPRYGILGLAYSIVAAAGAVTGIGAALLCRSYYRRLDAVG